MNKLKWVLAVALLMGGALFLGAEPIKRPATPQVSSCPTGKCLYCSWTEGGPIICFCAPCKVTDTNCSAKKLPSR